MNKILFKIKKGITPIAALLVISILYLLFVEKTHIAIPCIFHEVTGMRCAVCGTTTMLRLLLKLDFPAAFNSNQFIFVTAPLLAAEFIYVSCLYEAKIPVPKWNKLLIYFYIALLLIFMIFRNIYGF